MAPQVQLIHEEGQVVEAELRVVAHEQAAALLHSPVRHILCSPDDWRHQGPSVMGNHRQLSRLMPLGECWHRSLALWWEQSHRALC